MLDLIFQAPPPFLLYQYIVYRGGWQANQTMNNVYNQVLKSKQNAFDNTILAQITNLCAQTSGKNKADLYIRIRLGSFSKYLTL